MNTADFVSFYFWFMLSLTGLIFGSFNTVLISRIPDGKSIGGRSHCPVCDHQINWYENIPILSYFFLRGRCASCKSKISPFYPIVELSTLIAVLIFVPNFDRPLLQILALITSVLGTCLTFIDFKYFRLPDVLTLSLATVTFLFLLVDSYLRGDFSHLRVAVLSSLILTLLYFTIWFTLNGMGLGDVKYALSVGALSGYSGYLNLYVSVMISLIIGSIAGIFMMIIKGATKKTQLAFGPFMFAGLILAPYVTPHISKLWS